MPADELERFVAQAIRNYLSAPDSSDLIPSVNLEILQQLHRMKEGGPQQQLSLLLRAQIWDGVAALELDANTLANTIGADPTDINTALLCFEVPFTQRRRGIETRFVMSGSSSKIDQLLIANIARAHAWLVQIKQGSTIDAIAKAESTSSKRVQQILEFAFLAPNIVRDIIAGKHPVGLTSTWCMTHGIPADWVEQRELIATL